MNTGNTTPEALLYKGQDVIHGLSQYDILYHYILGRDTRTRRLDLIPYHCQIGQRIPRFSVLTAEA